MGCLIVFKSITYAQKAYDLLSQHGIWAQIVRAPTHLAHGSCSYALRVPRGDCEKISMVLAGYGATGFYTISSSGTFSEVKL